MRWEAPAEIITETVHLGDEGVEELVDESEVEEEIEDLSEMIVVTGVGPAPTSRLEGRRGAARAGDASARVAPARADAQPPTEEIGLDEVVTSAGGSRTPLAAHEPPSARPRAPSRVKADVTERAVPTGHSLAARRLAAGDVEMVAVLEDGVKLFARLDEGREDAFQPETVDLLIQLVMVQGRPVSLVSLVDPRGERPYVRRAALDPLDDADRQVLDALRQSFRATVALHSMDSRLIRTVEVAAPRG